MRPSFSWPIGLAFTCALAGCAPAPSPTAPQAAEPTASVTAKRETQAVASVRDAADDPAIWRDPARPQDSLIVATDKQAGLYVYGLDGKPRHFLDAGQVNNVDLRSGVKVGNATQVVAAASDRTDRTHGRLALFTLDTKAQHLARLASFPAEVAEAYGVCLYQPASGPLYGFVVGKDGQVRQLRLDLAGPEPKAEVVRRFALKTQSEGCVADDRTGMLYIAEEDVGVWRFSADPAGDGTGTLIAPADGRRLVADAEGVTLIKQGVRGGYLVVSSQGDSAYAVYRIPNGEYAGRFRIADNGKGIDGTSETDGIDLMLGDFGPEFPGGLMAAQDGDNAPEAQNFKLVAVKDILQALKLR
jgi:3-phytase